MSEIILSVKKNSGAVAYRSYDKSLEYRIYCDHYRHVIMGELTRIIIYLYAE